MTIQKRKVAIIRFPGITRDETAAIAKALRKATVKMDIQLFITNADVETMSKFELLSILRREVA